MEATVEDGGGVQYSVLARGVEDRRTTVGENASYIELGGCGLQQSISWRNCLPIYHAENHPSVVGRSHQLLTVSAQTYYAILDLSPLHGRRWPIKCRR